MTVCFVTGYAANLLEKDPYARIETSTWFLGRGPSSFLLIHTTTTLTTDTASSPLSSEHTSWMISFGPFTYTSSPHAPYGKTPKLRG